MLADTHGDHFRADLHRGFDEQVYKEFLCGLLGRSLDIDLANFGGLTARDIDESVQSKHGRRNPFGKVLNAYMLHDKLADTLPDNKPGKPGKQLI